MEQAKKRNSKINITDIAISKVPFIEVYSLSKEQNELLQQKHKQLLKIAKEKNNSNEIAIAFRLDFSETEIQFGSENMVSLEQNPIIVDMVIHSDRNTIFITHNHPSTQKFSYSDYSVILMNETVFGISVVTNTGEVHILCKNSDYNTKKAFELLTSIKLKYLNNNIFNNEVDFKISNEFLKNCYKCGLIYKRGGGTNGK